MLAEDVRAISRMQLLPERRAHVRLGPMVQQQLGERRTVRRPVLVHPVVRLRHHRREQRRVPTKTIAVHRGSRVHVHPLRDEPSRDLHLVVVDAHVQQRCSSERRSMRRQHLVMAAELRRVDLFVTEGATQQVRISPQMLLEEIDAPAMQRHRRRVGQLEPMRDVHLQDLVLCRWLAAVRFQHYVHRRESFACGVIDPGAKLEHERRP